MPALKLTITPAGRAALANAEHNGTAPVLLTSVGVTATSFDQNAVVALPGEIKRVATLAGGATAADTLHVTMRDESSDTYTVRGLGLYLADGTLFGVYSQATVLLEKSAQATALLALDVQFADINANSLTFGDTNFQLNAATTEQQGMVELATDDETTAGTDAMRAVTPKSLLAALNARLGAGNPSAFVKSLLDKVSALAFVTALGIRGAASYDTGAGNGLDADKLDGQHGAYYSDFRNLTNVPATASRWPAVAEVTGLQGALDVKQALLGFTPVQQGTGVGQLGNTVKIGWSGTKLKATVDASDQGNIAFEGWVSGNYANLSGASFTGPVSAKNYASTGLGTTDLNTVTTSGFYRVEGTNPNMPPWAAYGQMIVAHGANDTIMQIASGFNSSAIGWRSGNPSDVGGGGTWGAWRGFWHEGNFDPATKLNTNTGIRLTAGNQWMAVGSFSELNCGIYISADGGLSITYNWSQSLTIASDGVKINESIAWHAGNFDPNSKAAAGHNHDSSYLKINPPNLGSDANAITGQFINIGVLSDPTTNTPNGSWTDIINVCDGQWGFQLASPFFAEDLHIRSRMSGAFTAWRKLVSSDAAGNASLTSLAASGAITGGSIRSTGTIMAAGGFQIG